MVSSNVASILLKYLVALKEKKKKKQVNWQLFNKHYKVFKNLTLCHRAKSCKQFWNVSTFLCFQVAISSVQFSHSVVSDSLQPHESQHARPPCPSPTPRVHSDSRPLSRWCHPVISSSVVPFSSCPQSLPASESFPMSQLFTWGGQSTGVSASALVLPMNTQDWSPLGWTIMCTNWNMFF